MYLPNLLTRGKKKSWMNHFHVRYPPCGFCKAETPRGSSSRTIDREWSVMQKAGCVTGWQSRAQMLGWLAIFPVAPTLFIPIHGTRRAQPDGVSTEACSAHPAPETCGKLINLLPNSNLPWIRNPRYLCGPDWSVITPGAEKLLQVLGE